jgi:hypothetical protein
LSVVALAIPPTRYMLSVSPTDGTSCPIADVLQCTDGSTVWFDITDVLAHVTQGKRDRPEVKRSELDSRGDSGQ